MLLLLTERFRPSKDWRLLDLGYLSSEFTFTRASSGTYRDSAGVRQTAGVDVPRFDHASACVALGLLIEESRTNYLLNSTAPATQTTGILSAGTYTL